MEVGKDDEAEMHWTRICTQLHHLVTDADSNIVHPSRRLSHLRKRILTQHFQFTHDRLPPIIPLHLPQPPSPSTPILRPFLQIPHLRLRDLPSLLLYQRRARRPCLPTPSHDTRSFAPVDLTARPWSDGAACETSGGAFDALAYAPLALFGQDEEGDA